jgi:ribosome-associated protein
MRGPKPQQPLKAAAKPKGGPEPITLAQFLKVVQVADTGGQAKHLVREGRATVNGEAEDRPGRKLAEGDIVAIDGKTFTVDR